VSFTAIVAIMSSALALYVAALNHRFSRAPGWHDQRWFSAVALSFAGYSAMNVPIAISASDGLVVLAARVQLLFMTLHVAGWILYARAQLGGAGRRERALVAGLVGLGVVALLPGAVYRAPVVRTSFAPLQAVYAIPTTTWLADLTFGAVVLGIVTVAVRYAVACRRGVPHAWTQFAALALFTALAVNDALVAAAVYRGPYLIDLAFLVPLATVAYSLTSRFADDARALAELRRRLQSLVDDRTRELTQAQEALHRAEKLAALGQFSTGVAHEVNNPAAVVSANLKYLSEGLAEGVLPPDTRECIEESLSSVSRITAIVRQLLDAGRLAVSTVKLEPVSLARCAREAAATARARFPQRVSLGLTIDEDLYALGQEHVVVQVLANLLVNGAQAVPEGRAGHVTVRAERAGGGRVRAIVEDDGAGMDEEVRRRVFEPFFSTKPLGVGTGLGLAVSRGLAASLGATLAIDSAPGRGTRVTVDLLEACRPELAAAAAAPIAPAGRRRRVLLVDDEPAVLRALTRLLEPHYVVYRARSVVEALALADLHRPDLLLCDVVMPDGGGPELYRGLHAHAPDLAARVVFITGGASQEGAREFLPGQPQPVVEKPLDLAALARIAERLAPEAPAVAARQEPVRVLDRRAAPTT
jgi:signal transduction histidine kinase/ActR/RegA family two-component response regulator